MTIRNDISEIVLSEEEINKINQRLGEQITKDYEGKNTNNGWFIKRFDYVHG